VWPFKKTHESPQEIAAEEKLDEATRDVGWDEFDKEERRETLGGGFGVLTGELFPEERAGDVDRDPAGKESLRDTLHEGDEKT
jgi:hypothetical protein